MDSGRSLRVSTSQTSLQRDIIGSFSLPNAIKHSGKSFFNLNSRAMLMRDWERLSVRFPNNDSKQLLPGRNNNYDGGKSLDKEPKKHRSTLSSCKRQSRFNALINESAQLNSITRLSPHEVLLSNHCRLIHVSKLEDNDDFHSLSSYLYKIGNVD